MLNVDTNVLIAFFDASGPDLPRGIVIVTIWLVAATLLGLLCAYLLDRRAPA